jgi:hypothetical protein
MRDRSREETTLVSGPPLGGDPDLGVQRFLQATPDGSQVFFTTQTSYTEADGEGPSEDEDMDIYRWSAATGKLLCITCSVPGAELISSGGGAAQIIVSEDGTHAYFSSIKQFAGAPSEASESEPNTYVWQLGHPSLKWVARTSGLTSLMKTGTYVTPDGDVLLFTSSAADLDELTDAGNGEHEEIYRYDARDGSLSCLSCPEGGVATKNVPFGLIEKADQPIMALARPASDDGNSVFFAANDALVPQDTNNRRDLYEWHDGHVSLITSGKTVYPNGIGPSVLSTTPDGHEVFFLDPARLTPDAQGEASKLYAARIGGGFAAPAAPVPCEESACQTPPTPQPPALGLTSEGSGAPGNVSESHARKPRRHHKHKRSHKRAAKHNRRAGR